MVDDAARTQATFCATLVDEWARAGVTLAVIAPGSRSTPLALALAADDRIAVQVHLDERCAAFTALGAGLASGLPAIALCTSGTAATHFHAAVVEAHHARVPLLVCTADRPPELRDVGAPQAIDQTHLYGSAVRWFFDPGPPDEAMRAAWRSMAARAVAEAADGPVHLNLPFREPLVADPGDLPAGRPDGRPWVVGAGGRDDAAPGEAGALAGLLGGRRGVVIAGAGAGKSDAIEQVAGLLGWPVLADPRSGYVGAGAVHHADAVLRAAAVAEELRPEAVLRLGAPPASKVLAAWLAGSGAEVVVHVGHAADPDRLATASLLGDAATVAAALGASGAPGTAETPARSCAEGAVGPSSGLAEGWVELDRRAEAAIAGVLVEHAEVTEPGTARAVVATAPAGGHVVVASSMPVRDVEWYATPRADVTVHANRGANGIDGVLSTAVGVALGSGAPTACLLGDVALLHDSSGLTGITRRGIDLSIVVVDNDGGGIFSFLPQAETLGGERFEQLFGTPHGVRPESLAAAHGIPTTTVEHAADLPAALAPAAGVRMVVVRTDRAANVALHAELNAAVTAAVTGR